MVLSHHALCLVRYLTLHDEGDEPTTTTKLNFYYIYFVTFLKSGRE